MAPPLGVALSLLVVLLTASSCTGLDFFVVDGPDGWTTHPVDPYYLHVNDTLVFKVADEALLVSKSHYDACNTTDPLRRLDGGNSSFVLAHSGHYYFISGNAGRCQASYRLIVQAQAIRISPPLPSPPPKSPLPPPPPKSLPPTPIPKPSPLWAPPLAAGNASSTSSTPANAPSSGTNGTLSTPSLSSAVALRAGILVCLAVGGAAILV